jgi:hypothetical protein
MSVVGFDAATPDATDVTAVATGSQLAYVSTDHLYVAASPDQMIWGCCRELTPQTVDQATDLYAFDLSGTSARYVGAGSVDGQIADARSMDEYDGVLRVAIGSAGGGATNSVVLLRPESGRLVEVGRLDGLGVDQQILTMRWFDGLAVMVTFQQVDPFYVLDLADPAHPRVVGVLHLPGWSSYLHPVGRHLILGLGQTGPSGIQVEVPPVPMPPVPQSTAPPLPPRRAPSLAPSAPNATLLPPRKPTAPGFLPVERAKATLFDIGDLTHPRAIGTVHYPRGSIAQAGLDPHQVTWLPDTHTLLTVVSQGYGGPRAWISVLRIHGGSLHGHLIPVNALAGTDSIRTVPLDDGRVLLVTPTSVRFLAV